MKRVESTLVFNLILYGACQRKHKGEEKIDSVFRRGNNLISFKNFLRDLFLQVFIH